MDTQVNICRCPMVELPLLSQFSRDSVYSMCRVITEQIFCCIISRYNQLLLREIITYILLREIITYLCYYQILDACFTTDLLGTELWRLWVNDCCVTHAFLFPVIVKEEFWYVRIKLQNCMLMNVEKLERTKEKRQINRKLKQLTKHNINSLYAQEMLTNCVFTMIIGTSACIKDFIPKIKHCLTAIVWSMRAHRIP